ncbi:MAG: M23 family metallopeptidase [Candidatus Zophobacter franzmannii]|jgi:murein DD-endopeptidase MepM/ murein hydrolase activator NlpD|nr:M23 family metallopeptidase [Candidatus Zophobacter franzmannii]
MLRLVRITLLFVLLFSCTYAIAVNEIDSKKDQLKHIEDELNKSKQKLIATEEERNKKETNLKKSLKLKKETEKKLKKLNQDARLKKDSLWVAHVQLLNSKRRINRNTDLLNNEFHYLYLEDTMSELDTESMIDAFLLATSAGITLNLIEETLDKKESYKKIKEEKETVYNRVFQSMKNEKQKKNLVSGRVNSLTKEVRSLEEEKKSEEHQIKELEDTLKQLQELIAKLESEITKENRTYLFDEKYIGWPVKGKIIAGYGLQKNPLHGTTTLNNGIEIATAVGTEIKAAASGVVVFAEDYMRLGNVIVIDHKNGFMTVYSYNSSLLISKGSEVTEGSVVALSGAKPRSGEACLHFELRRDGKPVDPMTLLDKKGVDF